ncbi:hypothetical protein phi1422_0066 [Bdellovibrio phage phi1422]|uniref:structural protein n=1 Tax=Bdellovibrio phage phi1422 TaxID=1127515 RepID=UPI0002536D76|nr:structural protein [Bdellovibrio phage phi1422]AFC22586.1 hypothetical protein phi1422_0066 [Bdellovibrio phage phi1422]
MTDQELLQYYADLLILQYRDKPKASATVKAYVNLLISGQLPLAVQNAFDIETAVGKQLDVIGKIVGVTRDGYTFSEAIVLNDDDYRKMIKMKIFLNNSDSSLYSIQNLIALYFQGLMKVYDYQDMSMSYALSSAFGSQDLVEVFINKGLLPRPMGVGLGATIYHPTMKFFGFRTYQAENPNAFPFNTYDNYNEQAPWLLYAYAVNATTTVDELLLTEDGVNNIITEDGEDILV